MRADGEQLFSRLLSIVENSKAKMEDRLKAQKEIQRILGSWPFPIFKSDREEVIRRNKIVQISSGRHNASPRLRKP